MYESPLQTVVSREPWRQRIGLPSSILDPQWTPEEGQLCTGEVNHEGGQSKCWVCTKCGYIGWASQTLHKPAASPRYFAAKGLEYYKAARLEEGCSEEEISEQVAYLTGIILRHASARKVQELRAFVEGVAKL